LGRAGQRESKGSQNVSAEHCSVSARVQQKQRLDPRAVGRQDLAGNYRTEDLVIRQVPVAGNEYRSSSCFPEEYNA
jgi:hypothetical protein